MKRWFSSAHWPASAGLVAMLLLFGWPLLTDLRAWDLHNDESIYSYAVDRILQTGDWLTPRSIPFDNAFLEKPPLKFWIVAGLIRLGLLPGDELGLRFVDALFGVGAFVYVYLIGHRLAGPLGGFAGVMVLFGLEPLVLEHGLRSNNMEAAVLLCYCGGIWHFARWAESGATRTASRHALAAGAFFVLGFMTKFVAALFLPLVCAVAFLWQQDAWRHVSSRWREWVAPAILVLALTLPWFVYQTVTVGAPFWEIIVGRHVFARFTAAVDPRHLQPWSFYFTQAWTELVRSGSQWLVLAGVGLLAAAAWRGKPWLARLLIVWALLPLAIISTGTSKLFHYAYPFLPPLALAGGYAAGTVFRTIARQGWVRRAGRLRWGAPLARGSGLLRLAGPALLAAGTATLALGVWTAVEGPVRWDIDGIARITSSSVARPASLGIVMLWLAGNPQWSVRILTLAALALVLPVSAYLTILERTTIADHPLRSVRNCAARVHASGAPAGNGVYDAVQGMRSHSYYYYLRGIGAWKSVDRVHADELGRRLFVPGHQTPVIMSRRDYMALLTRPGERPPSWMTTSAADRPGGPQGGPVLPGGVSADPQIVIILPGPFQACVSPAVEAGGVYVGLGRPYEPHQ